MLDTITTEINIGVKNLHDIVALDFTIIFFIILMQIANHAIQSNR